MTHKCVDHGDFFLTALVCPEAIVKWVICVTWNKMYSTTEWKFCKACRGQILYLFIFIHTLNSVTFDYYAERQCGATSLPRAPTNGHGWELNPRPFDQSDWVWRVLPTGSLINLLYLPHCKHEHRLSLLWCYSKIGKISVLTPPFTGNNCYKLL